MSNSEREVVIRIGKRTYSLQTSLDGEALDRVVSLSEGMFKSMDDSLDQEHRLVLAFLQLSFCFEKESARLEELLS